MVIVLTNLGNDSIREMAERVIKGQHRRAANRMGALFPEIVRQRNAIVKLARNRGLLPSGNK